MIFICPTGIRAQDNDYQAGLSAYANGNNTEALTLPDRAITAYEQQGDTFRAE